MGYSKCAVAGCPSRPNEEILFKYWPTNPDLAAEWKLYIPQVSPRPRVTAVCEKHFEACMFEPVRQDNKKKLKSSAVPFKESLVPTPNAGSRKIVGATTTVTPSPLKSVKVPTNPLNVFCDITNEPSSSSLQPQSTPRPRALKRVNGKENMKECDEQEAVAAAALVSLALAPRNVFCDITNREPSRATHPQSTPRLKAIKKPKVLENLKESDVSEPSRDELLLTVQSQQAVIDRLMKEKNEMAATLAAWRKDKADMVIRMDNEKQLAAKTLASSIQVALDKQKTRFEESIDKLSKSATHSLSLYFSLKKRHDSLRKCRDRLQNLFKRRCFSPWLHESQQKLLPRKNARGIKWDPSMIRKGLILKMRCGTSGYSAFVREFPILPSPRSLQEAVQFVKFDSGILNEVFDILEVAMEEFPDFMKDCMVVMDEMAIAQGRRFCHSLKKFVGESTFPSHSGKATKALIFLLAGVARRWKITVAVYFTNKKEEKGDKTNLSGVALKEIVDKVIEKAESIGAKVCAVTSDMGPDNLAMWKANKIVANRTGPVRSVIPKPGPSGGVVHILPDVVHLFKAIKSMMDSNKIIVLPQDIVEKEGLSSAIVNYGHLDDLMHFEEDFELKVAFRLKPWTLHCDKQFNKMKVGTTTSVVSHQTSVGLGMLAEHLNDDNYRTTAWFIDLLNTFFELVTSRHKSLAFSHQDETVFLKAVNLINKVGYVFQNMRVGENGHWKPCQRGMRVYCQGLLNLVNFLLKERGYLYVLPGRFTSDCIENVIGLVRLAQAIPHAVAVLQNLKVITLCQLSEAVKGSSYDFDGAEPITSVDILEVARAKAARRNEENMYNNLQELMDNPVPQLTLRDLESVHIWERCVIYDMAGSVLRHLQKRKNTLCDNCISATKQKGPVQHPCSKVTVMKEYIHLRSDKGVKRQLLTYVTDEVFKAILTAELTIRMMKQKIMRLKTADIVNFFVENLMYVWTRTDIPNCHGICRRILTFFVTSRLKEIGRREGEEIKEARARRSTVVNLNSKSVAMRESASQIRTSKEKKV